MTTNPRPTVFISYSHKDEGWKDKLLPQLRALELAGQIVVWDDRKIDGGDTWYPEIRAAMEQAAVALCLISPDYLASRFCVKEEVPYLLQRRERERMALIPVLLRPCPWRAFKWLKEIQMLPRDGKSVVVDFQGIEDAVFADVANLVLSIFEDPAYEPPAPPPPLWSPPEKVDTARMPRTGAELFGRRAELEMLDEAWESEGTHVVSLVAWGGVGKSTLVNKWLEQMDADNYRGARRVYAWSFYSQGTNERVTSADLFINNALEWFGDKDPTAGSPWDKGERLAGLVSAEKTLLLLDGLEPLQSPHTHERGKIKDPALSTLLTELARENQGLCLITTRERVTDLEEFPETVLHKDLEQISDEAGRALLNVGHVRGTDAELERATRDFGNHALAVQLLAVYLREITGHHVSHAAEIPDIDIPVERGKHPRRLMAAFERRFGEGPEVELLRVLGLFDRPADAASLAALRKSPPIPGLTDHTEKLSEAEWLRLVEKLRRHKLIAPASHHRADDTLDAHPLVREHFGEQLKAEFPDAWREGNNRLYEHLKDTTKELPETIEEMSPLYAAVAHGCAAGRLTEVFLDVYWKRIQRTTKSFSFHVLSAFSATLSVLSNFYDNTWDQLSPVVHPIARPHLLNDAGVCLQALGRMAEALQPAEATFELCELSQEPSMLAAASQNLAELHLTMGNIPEALSYARRALSYTEHAEDVIKGVQRKVIVAHVLHQEGSFAEAADIFQAAEKSYAEAQPGGIPILHSIYGYRYCELLLSLGKYEEVITRTTATLQLSIANNWLTIIGLEHAVLGRAHLQSARHGGGDLSLPAAHLKESVEILRWLGVLNCLPIGLLALEELYRQTGDYGEAEELLEGAMVISSRGEMNLFKTDCHLAYARLYKAQGLKEKAVESLAEAKRLVEKTGYHRRDAEVTEIEKELE